MSQTLNSLPFTNWYTPLRELKSKGSQAEKIANMGELHAKRELVEAQYFTPHKISYLMWKIAESNFDKLKDNERIYIFDNSIGSGRLVQFADPEKHTICGIDTDARMIQSLSEALEAGGFLFDVQCGSMEEFRIRGSFAVAFINPPFSRIIDSPFVKNYPTGAFGKYGKNSSHKSHIYALHQALDESSAVIALLPMTMYDYIKDTTRIGDAAPRLKIVYRLPANSFKEENANVDVGIFVFTDIRDIGSRPGVTAKIVQLHSFEWSPALRVSLPIRQGRFSNMPSLIRYNQEDSKITVRNPVTFNNEVRLAHSGRNLKLKFKCGITEALVMNRMLGGRLSQETTLHGGRLPAGVSYSGQGKFDLENFIVQDDPEAHFKMFVADLRKSGAKPNLEHEPGNPGILNYIKRRARRQKILTTPLGHTVYTPDKGLKHWLSKQESITGVCRIAHAVETFGGRSYTHVPPNTKIKFKRHKSGNRRGFLYEYNAQTSFLSIEEVAQLYSFKEFGNPDSNWVEIHKPLSASFSQDYKQIEKRVKLLGLDKWQFWGYQFDDLCEIKMRQGNTIAAWEMGLGKALLSLALCILGGKYNLIIVEARLVREMLAEIKRLGIDAKQFQIIKTLEDAKNPRKINLISYTKLRTTKRNKNGKVKFPIVDVLKKRIHTLVADECFTYETEVTTNYGPVPIGKIVNNPEINWFALSCNSLTKDIEFMPILGIKKTPRKGILLKVKHEQGEFICTPNHKIWTVESGYVKAESLNSDFHLSFLQDRDDETEIRRKNPNLLFPQMRKSLPGKEKENSRGFNKTSNRADLSMVQGTFQGQTKRCAQKILQHILFSLLEVFNTQSKTRIKKKICAILKTIQRNKATKDFKKNEVEQSNVEPGNGKQSQTGLKRQKVQNQRWKREAYRTTEAFSRSVETLCRARDFNKTGQTSIFAHPKLLQSGYSRCEFKTSNRSGWASAPNETPKSIRFQENASIRSSRVVSVEVYESGNNDGFTSGCEQSEFVYDLEVETNHNYFANGTLVSNCHNAKNSLAAQTEALWRVWGKERYGMTGTPVDNYPRDILPLMQFVCGEGRAHQPYGKRHPFIAPANLEHMGHSVRGVDRFRELFITTEWVTNEFAEDLQSGAKREIPKIKDLDAFREMIAPIVKRRVMREPGVARYINIPQSVKMIRTIKWDTPHLKFYAKVAEEFSNWFRQYIKEKGYSAVNSNLIALLARVGAVVEACNYPQGGIQGFGGYYDNTSKQRYVIHRLVQLVKENHKIMVFAKSPHVLNMFHEQLNELGIESVLFHGQISIDKRIDTLDKEFRYGLKPILLASKGCMQAGYNLPMVDRIVAYDRDWNAKVELQAFARALRPQQKNVVEIELFHLQGSMDTYQDQMCNFKETAMVSGLDYGEDNLDASDFKHFETILFQFVKDFEQKYGVNITGRERRSA